MLPANERQPASGAPDAGKQEAWDRDFEASPPPPLPIGETGQPALDDLAAVEAADEAQRVQSARQARSRAGR